MFVRTLYGTRDVDKGGIQKEEFAEVRKRKLNPKSMCTCIYMYKYTSDWTCICVRIYSR